jgi:histidine triad (HIT) family protein
MASIFSKIAQGEIPSYKVAESDRYYAFLDINPLVRGHVLVIPREETDCFFDLSDDDVSGIMTFAKKTAKAIKEAIPCKRVGVAVIGLDVPHAHIHLIPLQSVQDIDFGRPKLKLTPEEFRETARIIAERMS